MNKQDQKRYAKTYANTLKNKVLKVIALFPPGSDWDDRHIREAYRIVMETGSHVTPEEIVKKIKGSWPLLVKVGFQTKAGRMCRSRRRNGLLMRG
jgi:hypothetical protein